VEGNGPKWRPVVRHIHKRETGSCHNEEGKPWDGNCCVAGDRNV
jgi:hypothetical protein